MIRQFDVCANPGSSTASDAPLICVLQSHYLEGMDTVMVAPMIRGQAQATATQVAVPTIFDGESYLLDLALMASLERRHLQKAVGSLLDSEYDIRRALDRLFTGF
ncbi:MAG: CcdB family protein [Brevundimonas sp.]|nr:CcdB family protein [Brevundimonas sp.]